MLVPFIEANFACMHPVTCQVVDSSMENFTLNIWWCSFVVGLHGTWPKKKNVAVTAVSHHNKDTHVEETRVLDTHTHTQTHTHTHTHTHFEETRVRNTKLVVC